MGQTKRKAKGRKPILGDNDPASFSRPGLVVTKTGKGKTMLHPAALAIFVCLLVACSEPPPPPTETAEHRATVQRLEQQIRVLEARTRPYHRALDSAMVAMSEQYYLRVTGQDTTGHDETMEGIGNTIIDIMKGIAQPRIDEYRATLAAREPEPEPQPESAPFSPVGVWNWTKRESNRDGALYLTWVYADGTGVARDGGCRAAITFQWEWDATLQTLTLLDPNVPDNNAELFFRDQQIGRSFGARTMTRTQSIHRAGRRIEGLRKPEMGDLLAVVPDPYTGLMHWEYSDPDPGRGC
jgi:hypothetical protein